MDKMKSIAEFDYYLAAHKACGQFVKLNYGLVSLDTFSLDGTSKQRKDSASDTPGKQPRIGWRIFYGDSLKSFITTGIFFTLN